MSLVRRVFASLLAVSGVALAALVPAAHASDDTYFIQQWNLAQIGAAGAWAHSTGAGITIGIVDTGVDADHPDLRSKIDAVANCIGGVCREGRAEDGHGHGTVVSGIAAAATGNGRGIAGVAPDARLVVAKAVDDQGRGDVGDIIAGIRWVVDRGARVVNLSLGDPNFLLTSLLGTPLRPGIEYAWSRNAVPVLASGNENVGLLDLGSSNYGALNALVVGATDSSGGAAGYSSGIGNAKWGLVAPGGSGAGPGSDILATYPGGRYAWVAGTSMAAPHVAGAVALLLAQGLTPTGAVQRILSTVDRSRGCGIGCQGRLDVGAAVAGAVGSSGGGAAGGGGPPPAAPPPSRSTTTSSSSSSSSTSSTRPTTTAPAPSAAAVGTGMAPGADETTSDLAAGSLAFESGDGEEGNTALVVLAVALLAGVGCSAGVVGWERFRAGEGW